MSAIEAIDRCDKARRFAYWISSIGMIYALSALVTALAPLVK